VQLDLTIDSSAAASIESIRPDMIIHTAATISPNVCHDDPAWAYQVNNCRALVEAVRNTVPDCLFVFTSTDMVYDGFQPPYLKSAAAVCSPSMYTERPSWHASRRSNCGAASSCASAT
jgi:dTDP-4-dehydrorhamnose reductase